MGWTTASGWMSRTRAATASALGSPIVEVRASSWRLILERATVSLSTSVSSPIPDRARHSAA